MAGVSRWLGVSLHKIDPLKKDAWEDLAQSAGSAVLVKLEGSNVTQKSIGGSLEAKVSLYSTPTPSCKPL